MTRCISGRVLAAPRYNFGPRATTTSSRTNVARDVASVTSGVQEASVYVRSCMPVIPSADLDKSLRFWVEGLGLTMDRAMRQDGRLIGCMVHDEHLYFWLNQRA